MYHGETTFYEYYQFDNLKDVKKNSESVYGFKYLYKLILEKFGDYVETDEYMNECPIYLYPTYEDFGGYELEDGWYSNSLIFKTDYNGAPNPFDYIDTFELGKDLVSTSDSNVESIPRYDNFENEGVIEFCC